MSRKLPFALVNACTRTDGRVPRPWIMRSRREIATLLIIIREQWVPTDRLVELLWADPDLQPLTAMTTTRQLVTLLNRRFARLASPWRVRHRRGVGYRLECEGG